MTTKDILKELRKKRGFSAKEVADGCEMSLGVYQKYESGERGVGVPALIKLADFYGVTTDYLLGREAQKNPVAMLNITTGEKNVVEKYVSLPENVRQIIMDVMLQLAEASRNENTSELPRAKVFVFRKLHANKAAAGSGYDLNNPDEWREIAVIDTPEAHSADFAVEVDGESMMPTYNDGDILYIALDPDVEVGQIGLFRQNGKGFVKERGKECLISHNSDYPDIYPSDGEIISVGRVIGIAEIAENK